MISKVNKDQNKPAFTYSYSSQNQLIRIQMTSSALGPVVKDISYNYDALGRRMEKRVVDSINPQNSKVRRFVYDGDNIIAEYDASNLLASYIHSPLRADDVLSVAVTSDGVNAGISSSAGNFYYLKDHLGSVTDVVNGSGARVQSYEYSAFGRILAIRDSSGSDITSSPILKTSYTFTGREWDDEAGLYYYRARYYDPMLGRFLQQDPDPGKVADPISIISKYVYANNCPINFSDPSGRFSLGNALGWAVALMNPTVSLALLNGTDLFQRTFGFSENDRKIFNTGYLVGSIIAASIVTGGAAGAAAGGWASTAAASSTYFAAYAGAAGAIAGAIAGYIVGRQVGAAVGAFVGGGIASLHGDDIQSGIDSGASTGYVVGGISGAFAGGGASEIANPFQGNFSRFITVTMRDFLQGGGLVPAIIVTGASGGFK